MRVRHRITSLSGTVLSLTDKTANVKWDVTKEHNIILKSLLRPIFVEDEEAIPPRFAIAQKRVIKSSMPTFATWCGGAGIGSIGLLREGLRPVQNIDCDPSDTKISRLTAYWYERNFGQSTTQITLQEVALNKTFVKANVVLFSQSCRNISSANLKAKESQVDIDVAQAACAGIRQTMPEVFLIENVPPYQGTHCLKLIKETLNELNYKYAEGFLRCDDFGVPQSRRRFFLIALKPGIAAIPYLPLPKSSTVRMGWFEALADIIENLGSSKPTQRQLEITSKRTKSSELDGLYLAERTGLGSFGKTPTFRSREEPAWTMICSVFYDHKNTSRSNAINIWHEQGEWKALNGRSVARLMSVPDWYEIPTYPPLYGRILCNGIPPMVTQAFAKFARSVLI